MMKKRRLRPVLFGFVRRPSTPLFLLNSTHLPFFAIDSPPPHRQLRSTSPRSLLALREGGGVRGVADRRRGILQLLAEFGRGRLR